MLPPFSVILAVLITLFLPPTSAVDFLYNSFPAATSAATPPLNLTDDARLEPPFVFSVLPEISSSPGFGLAFVLSASTSPPNALSGQYFGLFSGSTTPTVAPVLAIEFDTGRNPEFNDPDENHVGIDLNNIVSVITQTAGYYSPSGVGNNNSGNFTFVPVDMRNGQNIHAWVEFNGPNNEINVTIAPAGMARPGFPRQRLSGSRPSECWLGVLVILGLPRDINTTGLPVFSLDSSGSSLSHGAVAGIAVGSAVAFVIALGLLYWFLAEEKGLGRK
ncbi:L-type lectin-domain containing receptor kinase S.1 [Abeliophyllum distichum]|uniref:L-type lectin-domain containing receptor kinase S.1 n=1 Tax=Abeliophyllum distichum TaxID=126358 RepID=A0ABD1RVR7_9LAMI